MSDRGVSPAVRWVVLLAGTVVVLAGMRAAASLVSSVFLAFALVVGVSPFQRWLISRGLKPVGAFLVTVVVVALALIGLALLLWVGAYQFLGALPTYQAQIQAAATRGTSALAAIGISEATLHALAGKLAEGSQSAASAFGDAVLSSVSALSVALLLALFMLFDALSISTRLESAFPGVPPERLDAFIGSLRHWIVIMFYLNTVEAAVATVAMAAVNVPFAALWGVLTIFLCFVPIVGFWLSVLPPTILALLTGGPVAALVVLGAYLGVNVVRNNVLYPRWMKRGLDLSVFVSMLSLFFWTLVLGPLGSVLSIPLTLILQFTLLSSPDTRGIASLMSAGGRAPAYSGDTGPALEVT